MRKIAVVLVGALGVLACSKSPSADDKSGSASLTSGSVSFAPSAEEIRLVLTQARPNNPEINAFVITNQGGLVTLRGVVPDEQTRADMVNRVKSIPHVTDVRDELKIPAPTPAVAAIRVAMVTEEPQVATVVEHLIISDDGDAILIQGVVPDDATHDALLQSALKAARGRHVTDDMHISGK